MKISSAEKSVWRVVLSVLFLSVVGLPTSGWAVLGGPPQTPGTSKESPAQTSSHGAFEDAYTVYESRMPSGMVVREYMASSGKVFAVVWRGPSLAGLEQLLGAHFPAYAQAARVRPPSHSYMAIQSPDLVVQGGGRMRAFAGKAYLPKELPQGVSVDELL